MVAYATNCYFCSVDKLPSFLGHLIIPSIGKTTKFTNAMLLHALNEAKISLTKEQFIVLCHIEEEAKPQTSLVMITERNKGSLTRLLQTLERKKYVIKKSCEVDNRVNYIEITPAGREVLEKTKPIVKEVFEKAQRNISENELDIAMRVLEQIRQNVIQFNEK